SWFVAVAFVGDPCDSACAFVRSSRRTGLARRTSGSLGAADAAATAFCTIVGAGDTDGAIVGADATLFAGVSVVAGEAGAEVGSEEGLGETCAVDCACPGASRCTLRTNFITRKPIINTTMPKMSGIGETRSPLERLARRRT